MSKLKAAVLCNRGWKHGRRQKTFQGGTIKTEPVIYRWEVHSCLRTEWQGFLGDKEWYLAQQFKDLFLLYIQKQSDSLSCTHCLRKYNSYGTKRWYCPVAASYSHVIPQISHTTWFYAWQIMTSQVQPPRYYTPTDFQEPYKLSLIVASRPCMKGIAAHAIRFNVIVMHIFPVRSIINIKQN